MELLYDFLQGDDAETHGEVPEYIGKISHCPILASEGGELYYGADDLF